MSAKAASNFFGPRRPQSCTNKQDLPIAAVGEQGGGAQSSTGVCHLWRSRRSIREVGDLPCLVFTGDWWLVFSAGAVLSGALKLPPILFLELQAPLPSLPPQPSCQTPTMWGKYRTLSSKADTF